MAVKRVVFFSRQPGDQIGRIFRLLGGCLLWVVVRTSYIYIFILTKKWVGLNFYTSLTGHPGRQEKGCF
jgi:hypothetical protein